LKQEISFPNPQSAEPRDPAEPLSFWERVCEVEPDQWATETDKGYKVYLFEGHGLKGPYLAKLIEPFDIEWVKQNFGGGDYSATLNGPGGKIEASIRFSIDGEKLRKPPQNAQSAPAAAHSAGDNFQTEMLRIMREEQQETRRLLREAIDRGGNHGGAGAGVDPMSMFNGMVTTFTTMMRTMQPATPAPAQAMGITEILAIADKLRGPDLLEVLGRAKTAGIIGGGGGGNGDLLSQVTQLKEVAETLGFSKGEGQSWAQTLIEKGPEILRAGSELIDKYKGVEDTRLATARTVLAVQQNRGPVVPPPPGAPPAAVPQHASPAPPPPGPAAGSVLEVEPPTRQPVADQVEQMAAVAEQQLAFIKGEIVKRISAGHTGEQIVDWLDSLDPQICDGFRGFTVEALTMVFTADPLLETATKLQRFPAVMAEIVDYLKSDTDEVIEPTRPN
jgi:hypothetical protein